MPLACRLIFPVSERKRPTVEEIVAGWQPHKEKLKALSDQYGKPVIFTEIGYKSVESGAIEPWEWTTLTTLVFDRLSVTTQANAYEAFFNVFWEEDWFEGVYHLALASQARSNRYEGQELLHPKQAGTKRCGQKVCLEGLSLIRPVGLESLIRPVCLYHPVCP